MKLLIITRKVDPSDSRMGFFVEWIERFARQLEEVIVISWQPGGAVSLPPNVRLIGLAGSRLHRFRRLRAHVRENLSGVDGIFCHMNPEYAIMVALIARRAHKRLIAWYTHRSVTLRRWLMELLVDRVMTASPESFRSPLFPRKVVATGHGIDTDVFQQESDQRERNYLISIGRLSPSKHCELMIEAVSLMTDNAVRLDIVGDVPDPDNAAYREELLALIRSKRLENRVRLVPGVPHRETVVFYQKAGLFLNLSTTGSLDKAVLEAMACGSLVLTSNEAFVKLVPPECFISDATPARIADAINALLKLSGDAQARLRDTARSLVMREHSLEGLVTKIIKQFR